MGTRDHSVRIEVKPERWRQLVAVERTFGIEPQDFLAWLCDRYPWAYQDACINAGMKKTRQNGVTKDENGQIIRP